MSADHSRFIAAVDQLVKVITSTSPWNLEERDRLTGEILALGPRLGVPVEYDRISTAWGSLSSNEYYKRMSQWLAYVRTLRAAALKAAKAGRDEKAKNPLTDTEQKVLDNIKAPPEGRGNKGELSDRQRDILQVLFKKEAFDMDHRLTTDEIATEVEGQGRGSAEDFKAPVADLARRKLVDTKEGRGGGVWLSPQGKKHIKQARKL